MHVALSKPRIARKYCERDLGEAGVYEEIGNFWVIESLSARVSDVEGGLHTSEEVYQVMEIWVATRVSASADSDAGDFIVQSLEAGKNCISNVP